MSKVGNFSLITLLLVVLITSVEAINVDFVGPDSAYTADLTAGYTQCSRAEFDEPFSIVFWYVRSPGEDGYGTIADIDYGDGSETTSYFDYTFSNGSTTGENYKITAYVYPESGDVDSDSYDVTVWTSFEEAVTVSKSVTDEMEVGGSYEFSINATSPNDNYVITSIEVSVDGEIIGSKTFDRIKNATVKVAGKISNTVDSVVKVTVKVTGKIVKVGASLSGSAISTIIKATISQAWDVILRGTLQGLCLCDGDIPPGGNALDNETRAINGISIDNSTSVVWDGGNAGGEDLTGETNTDWKGEYSFLQEVPLGLNISLTLTSNDFHLHGNNQENQKPLICEYRSTMWIGRFGNVEWMPVPLNSIPKAWSLPVRRDFHLNPIAVKKPIN